MYVELVQEDTEVYFQSLNTFRSSLFYHLAICVGWLVARSDLIDAHTCGVTRGSQTIADHHCTQDNPAVIPPCLAWQLFGHSLFFSSELSVCCTIFPSHWLAGGIGGMAKFLSHLTPPKSKKKMASSEKQSCGASFGNFVSHEGDNGQTLWFGGRTSGAWGEYQYTYHPPPGQWTSASPPLLF